MDIGINPVCIYKCSIADIEQSFLINIPNFKQSKIIWYLQNKNSSLKKDAFIIAKS